MADPRAVEYARANLGKFPPDALKAALVKAGLPEAEAEEALREAAGAPAAAVAAPAAPAPAADPAGIVQTALASLSDPAAFYRAMPREGGWTEPMVFVLAMAFLSAVAGGAAHLLLSGRSSSGLLAAGLVVGGSVLGPLFVLLFSAFCHGIWRVLGSRASFETSMRCVAYTSSLVPLQALLGAVPVAGALMGMAAFGYRLYMLGVASVEVHGLPRNRVLAAGAILIGGSLLAAAFVLVLFLALFTRGWR